MLLACLLITCSIQYRDVHAIAIPLPAEEAALSGYRYTNRRAYVEMISPIARKVGLKYNYLPSVLAAQCIHETGYGGYSDANTASMIYNNNHLGMKSSLINDTWEGHSVWSGKSFTKKTPEHVNGRMIYISDSFRSYTSVKQCLTDYVLFMKWARLPDGRYKYRNDVIGNPSYKKTVRAVMNNGYCTDPAYAKAICRLIRKWHLTDLDEGFMVDVKGVSLSHTRTIPMKKGRRFRLTAVVKPANAADRRVRWKSSNPKVARVSSDGTITALKKGSVYIRAISRANPKLSARVKIRVR